MKNYLIFGLIGLTLQVHGQNQTNDVENLELSYEQKIAQKTCVYLSEIDSIPDPKKVITMTILRAIDTVHLEDTEQKYKRDWTVEGIRALNKKITDLLVENCEIVSIEKQ